MKQNITSSPIIEMRFKDPPDAVADGTQHQTLGVNERTQVVTAVNSHLKLNTPGLLALLQTARP